MPSVFNMCSRYLWFWKQRARIAWLVYVRPSVREVRTSILDEITSSFRLLSFLCSLTTVLYIPLKRSIVGERGLKWAHRRPQVYQLNCCHELSTKNVVALSSDLQRDYNTSAFLCPFAPRKHRHRSLNCVNPRTTLLLFTFAFESLHFSTLQAALLIVQPSAKREGFATIPDVTWEDVGALKDVREELTMAILVIK